MDIKDHLGETAGKVWQVLSTDGPQTVPQLGRKIKQKGEILCFALGCRGKTKSKSRLRRRTSVFSSGDQYETRA
jgi:hypothetical protein